MNTPRNTANHAYPASAVSARTSVGVAVGPPPAVQRLADKRRRASWPATKPAEVRQLKPDSASLSAIVRLAQQGDATAFETIYQLHCDRVYALCLRMLGDPVEAEDLAQEAFLQVFRKIHTFRGESAFSSWLHRLTANVVLMSFRKKKVATTSLDEMTNAEEESGMPRHEIGSPDLRLSGLFDRMNLQTAIAQLPQGFREMFLLHDMQGYEHKEVAKILRCSTGNSKSQLHKARKRLRELLRAAKHYRTYERATTRASLALAGGWDAQASP
jgi:RNA polymerase sigma-70 factor (ECF subfamily)